MAKPGYKTTEFWTALASQIVGLLILMGVVTAESGAELTNALYAVIGGTAMVVPAVGYIVGRAWLKREETHE
jgi:hypothetical protein